MTKADLIRKLNELYDEIEKQPRYGVLGSLGLPMATWGSGKTMRMIEGLFIEVEEMLKLLIHPDKMSDKMNRFVKHYVYYDYTYQKLRKVKKEIRALIKELESDKE